MRDKRFCRALRKNAPGFKPGALRTLLRGRAACGSAGAAASASGGYAAFEMLAVLVLLVLLALSAYTLTAAGAGGYESIMNSRDGGGSCRTAVSYMTMRLRQSDCAGALSLMDTQQGAALKITEDYGGSSYDTIIYLWDGRLLETFQESSMPFDPASGELIVSLDGMSLTREAGLLKISVSSGSYELSACYAPRSAEEPEGGASS